MSDTKNETTVVPVVKSSDFEILFKEFGDDAALIKKVITESKKVGFKAAVTQNLPEIITEVKDDIEPVKNAIPLIKSGWKTTEFWLIFLLGLANAILFGFTGKALPMDVNAVIGALLTIYTVVRGFVKAKTPVTPVVAPTVTTPTA